LRINRQKFCKTGEYFGSLFFEIFHNLLHEITVFAAKQSQFPLLREIIFAAFVSLKIDGSLHGESGSLSA
jgi:hypothetical protein